MPRSYTPEFKKKIVRLHLDEVRTYKSITAEYGVSKASISAWCGEFSKESSAGRAPDIQLETIYHILMAIMPYLPLDEEKR